jgi:uncharacterized protein YkwD
VRIVRRVALGLVVLAALVAVPASVALPLPRSPAASLSHFESSVLGNINTFRAEHGLTRLHLSPQLTSAAAAHSQQMAQDGYFAHESADGSAFWQRLQSFFRRSPAYLWAVGENLLWSSSALSGGRALGLWLASLPHRQNLLDPRWREIGLSAVHEARAPGVYHGLDVTILTADFGVRR